MKAKEQAQKYGTRSLSDRGLLAIVLGDAAAENLPAFTSISELRDIEEITGVTRLKIEALHEITNRYRPADFTQKITTSRHVADLFSNIAGSDVEVFQAAYLSRSNRVVCIETISQGGVSGTVVDIRIVLRRALLCRASCIILAHNHPSGELRPSQADISLTKKVKEAALIMDINLLDHVIISTAGYYSFTDEGNL